MLLTLIIFTPLLVALLLLLVRDIKRVKQITLLGTLVTFLLSLCLIFPIGLPGAERSVSDEVAAGGKIGSLVAGTIGDDYHANLAREVELMKSPGQKEFADQLHFVEFVPWIKSFNVNYFVAVDGFAVLLIILTTLLSVVSLGAAWNMDKQEVHGEPRYKGMRAFFILFLLLETALIGVFCAQDFLLFYVFWELVLLPMYFLVGIWGGSRRIYAAIKFFIYTLAGSLLMFVAMLYFYLITAQEFGGTFNVLALMELLPEYFATAQTAGMLCFIGLFVAFAVKVPIWPFHTWLPDAHVEAPTAISMILAGVLLKMGGYGLFRFSFGFMPRQAYELATFIAVLGFINIVYGAYVALGQKDFKRMVAYSSVSHMGFMLLGLAAMTKVSLNGASLQMINHGLSSAMMFALVGVIYDRAHHRDLNRFGGLATQMPKYAGLALIGFFASLGLPGLNGFISEMLVFFGSFQSRIGTEPDGSWWMIFSSIRMWTVLSSIGIVLTAAYLLWSYQRVFYGEMKDKAYAKFKDLTKAEWLTLLPLGLLCILLGILPHLALDHLDGSMRVVQNRMIRHVPEYAGLLKESEEGGEPSVVGSRLSVTGAAATSEYRVPNTESRIPPTDPDAG